MLLNLLAKIGLATASTTYTTFWYMDEVECPKSLIK